MRAKILTSLVAGAALLLPACSEAPQTETQDPPRQTAKAQGSQRYKLTYFTMPG